ncbi:MAG TPA: DUF3604 domain-containing protein [Burkholderiales bacterium]|nr:DUF3604 domain-containing protein [Burkholderiales bacterium]
MRTTILAMASTALLLSACDKTAPKVEAPKPAVTSPSISSFPMKEAWFGEQHMHTAYSLDAYIGGTRLTPFEAYQFAQGAEVEVNGVKHKLDRPLDWVAVTDHAEYIGEMYSTMTEGVPGHDDPTIVQLRGLTDIKERQAWFLKYIIANNRGANPQHPPFYRGPDTTRSAWKDIMVAAAEKNNQPGKFTAFVAFEWTAAPGGANLHRNVIFRDANVPDLPVSSYEVKREDALWDWLEGLEAKGMKPLAIPHNSNASKGIMFGAVADTNGKPFDSAYAKRRAHMEPLVEIMQVKGNSEVHRNFWKSDEFANFENADSMQKFSGRKHAANNFVRWALIEGLAWEQKLGENPFRLGFVGGTDNHNGLTAEVMEAGPYGKGWKGAHGPEDGVLEGRRTGEVGGWIEGKDENPGALTGVWSPENTRGALWDAMRARETFATSGTRMKLRFFGGSGLDEKPADAVALVKEGYEKGVPMGGVLAGLNAAPTFTVHAIKDPEGANLDRVQIVKGWVDGKGGHHERIVDVAWSGERKPGKDGKLPHVGNTVDLKSAAYTNSIGSAELTGSWTDPHFEPKQLAVYYARVLEIPTPRWSTIDAVQNDKPLLKDVPATIQERAWSSPIWTKP